MTPLSQPGWHPDADTLGAFAERALTEGERKAVVAHLAGCAHCRDVVFLAKAAEEAEGPARTAVANGKAPPSAKAGTGTGTWGRWWPARNWVLVIPAAALAAGAAIVFWVERPGSEGLPNEARTAQAPAIVQEPAPAGSTPDAAQSLQSSAAMASSMEAPAAKTPRRHGTAAPHPERSAAMSPSESLQPASAQPAMPDYSNRSIGGPLMAGAVHPTAPRIFPRLDLQQRDEAKAGDGIGATWLPSGNGLPELTPAGKSSSMLPAGVVLQGKPQVPQQRREFRAAPGRLTAALPLRTFTLPGGQPSVATAVLRDRIVALNPAGEVFLSTDGGRDWEPVTADWSGRVTLLTTRAQPFPDTSAANTKLSLSAFSKASGASSEAAEDSPASPAVAPLQFKLITDRREIWISSDGRSWRRQ